MMSGLSVSLPATPHLQDRHACVPLAGGEIPEIKGWNGSDIIIRTLIESATSEDNRTGCRSVDELLCSLTETKTKTDKARNVGQQSQTETAIRPKETESRLAQLGLVVALLGVISVVV
jgi:hypothetical protein